VVSDDDVRYMLRNQSYIFTMYVETCSVCERLKIARCVVEDQEEARQPGHFNPFAERATSPCFCINPDNTYKVHHLNIETASTCVYGPSLQ
jgi:hypothetical protein